MGVCRGDRPLSEMGVWMGDRPLAEGGGEQLQDAKNNRGKKKDRDRKTGRET